jgi:hypothetical protein
MKYRNVLVITILLLITSACKGDVCPEGSVTYLQDPTLFPNLTIVAEGNSSPTPSLVEIGGRMVEVDRLIQGPVCNDVWSGIVYVSCNVQVADWTGTDYPTFLKNCNLTVEPETVVYVAAHNDAAYYNGCSCHVEGETK